MEAAPLDQLATVGDGRDHPIREVRVGGAQFPQQPLAGTEPPASLDQGQLGGRHPDGPADHRGLARVGAAREIIDDVGQPVPALFELGAVGRWRSGREYGLRAS